MKQHNSTYFRRNMNKVFNTCEESCEPVLITTRKDDRDEPQQMVIISKAQYDRVMSQLKYTHERCSISDFSESEYLNEINGDK